MLAMLLEKEPRQAPDTDAEPEADHAGIAEGPFHLKFTERLYVGVREAAGFDCGRGFTRHLVGNTGFETTYSEAVADRGLVGNALLISQSQGFLALPRKSSIVGNG